VGKRRGKRGKRKRRNVMLVLVILLLGAASLWGLYRLAYRPRVPLAPVKVPTAVPTAAAERIEPSDRRVLEGILKSRQATPPR
jgi:hypothetical protein